MNTETFDPTKYTKSKWLKGSDLPQNRPVSVTIAKVWEQLFEQQGEQKVAMAFDELGQDLALNKTQVKTMIELFGTDPRAWVGQQINLLAIPSNYQGKPTIQFLAANSMPSFGGRAGNGNPSVAYSREDAERARVRPAQPAPERANQASQHEVIPF